MIHHDFTMEKSPRAPLHLHLLRRRFLLRAGDAVQLIKPQRLRGKKIDSEMNN